MPLPPPPPPPSSPYSPSYINRKHHRHVSSSSPAIEELPSPKPPSSFHTFRGDERAQDIFVEMIERNRRKGEKFRVLFPGENQFELERMDVWNHDSICTPSLILQPKTTVEIASCVRGYTAGVRRCLIENRRTGSKLGIPRLCIAGGRNSLNCIKEGSIVLDLGRMRGVHVDVKRRIAIVQGGARIMDLDDKLGRYGLMAVMGTCQNVGVVGCILGGGVGYTSRKHGLACDNVLGAQMVLGNGKVVECSRDKNSDLFWALRGGGGGVGIVASVTLKCYPLKNAAMVTFGLYAPSNRWRKNVLRQWSHWVSGDIVLGDEDDTMFSTSGAPKEVSSQLILETKSSNIHCISTSIDPEAIPQSEARLEEFQYIMKKKSKRNLFRSTGLEQRLPTSWDHVPGLAELKSNKFGALRRSNSSFRMVRYWDELQGYMRSEHLSPGNVFVAYKYARAITAHVIETLVEAAWGQKSPKNESRIFISSVGNAVNDVPQEDSPVERDINFFIFIEGQWNDTGNERADAKEKAKVAKWVHWTSNQLHQCEGVWSTVHPESTRDPVSKSGRSKPPPGWYNFTKANGEKLSEIKMKRDPRNVFSLAGRVSWRCEKGKTMGANPSDISENDKRREGVVHADDVEFGARKAVKKKDFGMTQDKAETTPQSVDQNNPVEQKNEQVIKCIDDFMTITNGDKKEQEKTKPSFNTGEDDIDEWSLAPVSVATLELPDVRKIHKPKLRKFGENNGFVDENENGDNKDQDENESEKSKNENDSEGEIMIVKEKAPVTPNKSDMEPLGKPPSRDWLKKIADMKSNKVPVNKPPGTPDTSQTFDTMDSSVDEEEEEELRKENHEKEHKEKHEKEQKEKQRQKEKKQRPELEKDISATHVFSY